MVSSNRRRLPAGTSSRMPVLRSSIAVTSRSAAGSASAMGVRWSWVLANWMLRRMLSAVFWPSRGSDASRPSAAACSNSGIEVTPNSFHALEMVLGPSPGTLSRSNMPSGNSDLRLS